MLRAEAKSTCSDSFHTSFFIDRQMVVEVVELKMYYSSGSMPLSGDQFGVLPAHAAALLVDVLAADCKIW